MSPGPYPEDSLLYALPVHLSAEVTITTTSVRSRIRRLCLLVALLHLVPGASTAQDPEEAEPDRWKVAAEMSFTDQSGNRVLRLLTGGLRISHLDQESFKLDGSLQSRYGKSNGDVVARNHYASVALDVNPERSWSPFLFVDAERDPFKRLDLRLNGGAGAKHVILRRPGGNDEISVSLALLYSREHIRSSEQDPFPSHRSLARWSLRVRGSHEIRSGISVRQVAFYQPEWDQVADYLLRSETEAKILLTERFALSVGYQLSRTARPPQGVEPNDRLFKTGLIIDF